MTTNLFRKRRLVPVYQEEKGQNVARVKNDLIIPLAVIEAILAAAVCYINYILRYDPNIREDCSMVNWEGVRLQCSGDGYVPWPVYNETDSSSKAVTFDLPEWVFFTCAIVVPSCLVIVVEFIRACFMPQKVKIVTTCKLSLMPAFRRIPRFIVSLMMGGAVIGTLVSVLKLLIISPRPNFLAVCSTNSTAVDDCLAGGAWFPSTACEGNLEDVQEALRSFPSYHATLAAYCGVWTAVYLSTAARIVGIYGASLVMVGAVFVMTIFGMTHHLFIGLSSNTDVVVGGILGAIAALYVTLVILNGFREHEFSVKVVRKSSPLKIDHPNILPIVPLHGADKITFSHNEPKEVHFEDDLLDSEDFGIGENDSSNYITFIPRATSNATHRSRIPSTFPTQAVNSNVGKPPSSNIPVPPPLPSYGPPPSYSRTEHTSSYNVPRQRFSAPVRSPQAPSYHDSKGDNILKTYYSRDSDVVPRARTETASYF
ncbi:phospholipid phosphatase-related protein type 1-like [Palaemon carinicauda]|uniref:phospholipid phosphatase-related protein type 1-like n=1 Tax=Palaemon carinicauda TaxID=392227 RepID=UPI0035B66F00